MRTQTDIITEVLVRNNRSTTDGFLTDSNLTNWYKNAVAWATSFKKWPFTEGRVQTTYASVEEWGFEGYKADSIRMIQVGGKALTKLNFEDYLTYKEKEPTGTEKFFSDFGRTIFINVNAGLSGTLVAYGQYQPAVDTTDESATTIFTDWDEEANESIVEKMTGYLKRKEHLAQEAELHDQRAAAKLEEVYKRILDEQFKYKTNPHSDGMFSRFDVLAGGRTDEIIKKNQWY